MSERGLPLEVRETIWKAREARGWSREQLADRVGTSRVQIWRVETGKRRGTRPLAIAIARELDLSPGERARFIAAAAPIRRKVSRRSAKQSPAGAC